MIKRKYKYRNRFDNGGVSISGLVETPTLNVSSIPNSISLPNATSLPTVSSGISGVTKGLSSGAINGIANAGVTLANKLMNPSGNSIGVGNALSTIGSAASAIPGVGGLIGTGVNLVGGLVNTMFGSNINEEAVAQVESNIANQKNMGIGASTTSDFLNMAGDYKSLANIETSDIGSDGWFSHKASNKAKELNREIDAANKRAIMNFTNTANNVNANTIDNLLANYAAYGGPISMRYTGVMSPFGNQFADGGGIHIKPSRKGTFTAAAKKHGKSVQAFASQVLANKDNYSPAMVKKANFARNASKWKHEDGGYLDEINNVYSTLPISYLQGRNRAVDRRKNFYGPGGSTREASTAIGTLAQHFGGENAGRVGDAVSAALGFVPVVGSIAGLADLGMDIYNSINSSNSTADNITNIGMDVLGLLPGAKSFTTAAKISKNAKLGKIATSLNRNTKKNVEKALKDIQKTTKNNSRALNEALSYPTGNNIFTRNVLERTKATNAKLGDIINTINTGSYNYVNKILPATKFSNAAFDVFQPLKAEGGFINNTHGGIFDNGVTKINEGGSHESNPFEGIQIGVDNQGIPNLVEEGEVVWNDYVFSNRLKVPKEAKKRLKLRGTTFADAAKEINKESEERPNDPISKNGLESSMSQLMMVQENMRAKKQRNKYAKGGRLFPDGGLTPYSNFTPVGNDFYTPEYMNFWNYVNNNRDYGQGLLKDINNGVYGDIGGNTLSYEDMMRLSHDNKRGPVHQAFMNAANKNYARINAAPIASTLSGVDNISAPTLNIGEEMAKIKPAELRYNSSNNSSTTNNKKYPTWLRYAPLVGNAISLGYNLLSKPDYSYADAILEAANDAGNYQPVEFNPIGNYLAYRPFDRDYYINKLNAQSGATRRALMNSSGANRAAAAANLLAADYNAQGKLGDLARQAEEYNLNQRQMVESFNRGTNQFNSEGRLKADMANQEARLKARSQRLSGVAQAMAMKQNIDNVRNQGIAANFSNLFEGLGNIGLEAIDRKDRDNLINAGLFGTLSQKPQGWNNNDWNNYRNYVISNRKSKGGKLKNRRNRYA